MAASYSSIRRSRRLALLLVIVIAPISTARFDRRACDEERKQWFEACKPKDPQQQEQEQEQEQEQLHFAIAFTGHLRAFMTDDIIATSLRVHLVQPLLRQRVSPWLFAHVKIAEHNRVVAPRAAMIKKLSSLGARSNVAEDLEVIDFEEGCRRDADTGETFCHPTAEELCSGSGSHDHHDHHNNHDYHQQYRRRALLTRAMKVHACLDQNYATYRALELVRRAEEREGIRFR